MNTMIVKREGIVDFDEKVKFINWINKKAEHFQMTLDSNLMALHIATEKNWIYSNIWTSCASDMRFDRFIELNINQEVTKETYEIFEDCDYSEFLIKDSVKGLTSFYKLVTEYSKI